MKNKTEYDSHHFKWIAEGLKKWDDIIEVAQWQLEHLKALKEFGCKIVQEVDNGHLSYAIPTDKVKEYCKKFEVDEDNLDPIEE